MTNAPSEERSEPDRQRGVDEPKPHHEIFNRFGCWQGAVAPGRDRNFLGVETRVKYFSMYERMADFSTTRQLVTTPPPQNEDYFEWVDLLESVSQATGCFRIMELGAGWGKWIANGAAAARQLNLDFFVVGVEAEPSHFKWMRRHLRENGIPRGKTRLVKAAVAATDGTTWFHVGEAADWYGQQLADAPAPPAEPESLWTRITSRLRPTPDERRVEKVRTVSLRSLLADEITFDLLDADVQGIEAEIFEAAADRVDACVRRAHIGTHSEENETRLRELFRGLGWRNVNDFACNRVNETPYGAMLFEDGVQTWVNPRS